MAGKRWRFEMIQSESVAGNGQMFPGKQQKRFCNGRFVYHHTDNIVPQQSETPRLAN